MHQVPDAGGSHAHRPQAPGDAGLPADQGVARLRCRAPGADQPPGKLAYPIRDGIPIMLPEEARAAGGAEPGGFAAAAGGNRASATLRRHSDHAARGSAPAQRGEPGSDFCQLQPAPRRFSALSPIAVRQGDACAAAMSACRRSTIRPFEADHAPLAGVLGPLEGRDDGPGLLDLVGRRREDRRWRQRSGSGGSGTCRRSRSRGPARTRPGSPPRRTSAL